jgi:hypothetical protein
MNFCKLVCAHLHSYMTRFVHASLYQHMQYLFHQCRCRQESGMAVVRRLEVVPRDLLAASGRSSSSLRGVVLYKAHADGAVYACMCHACMSCCVVVYLRCCACMYASKCVCACLHATCVLALQACPTYAPVSSSYVPVSPWRGSAVACAPCTVSCSNA